MDASTFKKCYEHSMNFYYGIRSVMIIDYYDTFGFVDVIDYPHGDDIFSLPISVLTEEERSTDSIYLNRIYDMSKF